MLQDIISLDDEKIFKFICDFAECVSPTDADPAISLVGGRLGHARARTRSDGHVFP